MSVAAPFWLALAGIVAAGVVVAHLFSTNVPPRQVLPTVRFIPQGAPMAVLRTRRLTDVGLLLLRLLAIALLGLALAGARLPRSGPARVVVVDMSRAVAAVPARTEYDDAAIVVFDSVARTVSTPVLDTLRPTAATGSLSAGIVAAHRAVAGVTTGREGIELVIVSPVVREEVDSATARLIALWEGPVRIQRVPAAAEPARAAFALRASGDDPIAASLSAAGREPRAVGVRILRDQPAVADFAWAHDSARVLVFWPDALSAPSASSASSAWSVRRRENPDTAHGFATETHTVVGTFHRAHEPPPGRVIAWWMDGEPAATEVVHGRGCIRVVTIPVDPVGDIALRESFRGFVRSLVGPCGGARDFSAVPDSAILPGSRPGVAAPAPVTDSRLPLLLALLALATVGAEQLLRARRRVAA